MIRVYDAAGNVIETHEHLHPPPLRFQVAAKDTETLRLFRQSFGRSGKAQGVRRRNTGRRRPSADAGPEPFPARARARGADGLLLTHSPNSNRLC